MSVIVKSVGGGSTKPELFTYVLQTESGDEGLLQYVGAEEVTLTAVAEDIKIGKVAINEEGVVTGTHVCPTVKELTADADATAGDILNGKTAYVNGEKITGTAEIVDTTDATATAGDIRSGVTAYVNGEKITGTWVPALVTKSETKTLTRKNPGFDKTLTLTFTFSGNISGTPTFTATQHLSGLTWGGTFGTPTISGNTCTVVFTSSSGGSDAVDFKATASVTVIE